MSMIFGRSAGSWKMWSKPCLRIRQSREISRAHLVRADSLKEVGKLLVQFHRLLDRLDRRMTGATLQSALALGKVDIEDEG
jgi:hypothetical protein